MSGTRSNGFTLIELLIVVAVIGILTAIAIPNVLNALNRGKQKRTMVDLRSIGAAVERYAVDHSTYPLVDTITSLDGVLAPIYVEQVPLRDAWGHEYIVDSTTVDYTVGSGGRDGGPLDFRGGATDGFDDAIIYSMGQFSQWPEGTQR